MNYHHHHHHSNNNNNNDNNNNNNNSNNDNNNNSKRNRNHKNNDNNNDDDDDDDDDDNDCQLKIIPWRYRNIVLKIFVFFFNITIIIKRNNPVVAYATKSTLNSFSFQRVDGR